MIDVLLASKDLAGLAVLKYFPSDDAARTVLLRIVCDMADSNEQIKWLVRRTLALHNEWPGPKELRAVFCSRYRPKDGINAYSQVYVDGIPAEKPAALPPADQKALPPGAPVTEDPTLNEAVKLVAKAKAMPKAQPPDTRFSKQLAEILTPPRARQELPRPEPISNERRMEIQQQIDAELRKAGRVKV